MTTQAVESGSNCVSALGAYSSATIMFVAAGLLPAGSPFQKNKKNLPCMNCCT